MAVSGGENDGGCQVWLSSDGTNYKQIGEILSPARHGFLTEPMASGTDPDCDVAPVDELLRARREYALPDARLLSVTNAKGYTSSAVDRAVRHSVELVARDRLMRFLENG